MADDYLETARKKFLEDSVGLLDPGLYPTAFCKIVPDIAGDPAYCTITHSDSAGTKASLAYMYYRETGDIDIFRGIVQDAIVMNVDDVACVGAVGPLVMSNTLSRNKYLIPSEVVNTIINEYDGYAKWLTASGVSCVLGGGETADVGDLIRTIDVVCTITARLPRSAVVDNGNIQPGDAIVGLAASGTCQYEPTWNSGIGSNGLTVARQVTLHPDYRDLYPETYDPTTWDSIYAGSYHLKDQVDGLVGDFGHALLAPTRSYAPVLREVLVHNFEDIHGVVHCTGGGQTKCMKFGQGIHYIKNNLFPVPRIFEIIQKSSGKSWQDMYQIFNMGHRMEIMCESSSAPLIISVANSYGVDAQVVGTCEASPTEINCVTIEAAGEIFTYSA
jgi:phosphoribosylformylglycinamidine cyclo-ligase